MSENTELRGQELHIELWMRELHPNGVANQQDDVISRVQQLEEVGIISELAIDIWGTEIPTREPTSNTDICQRIRAKVTEFEHWAAENGHTLAPAFATRTRSSPLIQDKSVEVTILPVLCVAVYIEGKLQGVFPYSDEDQTHPVEECLMTLETELESLNHQTRTADALEEVPNA